MAAKIECTICGKVWQVSPFACIPAAGYRCPRCDRKQKSMPECRHAEVMTGDGKTAYCSFKSCTVNRATECSGCLMANGGDPVGQQASNR